MPEPNPPSSPPPALPPRPAERAEEIYSSFPPLGPKPDSYLQWSGSRQMNVLLVVICAMAVLALAAWTFTRPDAVEAVALLGSRDEGAAVVNPTEVREVLRELQERHAAQFADLFQMVVMSVLMPLFTLLAGYVFGRSRPAPGGDGPGSEG